MAKLESWPLTPEVQALKDERDKLCRLENKMINNDHENVVQKLKYFTMTGVALGTSAAGVQMIQFDPPRTHAAAYRTMFRIITPPALMGAMYASMVKVVASMRQRDDVFNHVVAGFAAGSVWGARTGSQRKGILAGALFAFFGSVFKFASLNDLDILYGWSMDGFYPWSRVHQTQGVGFHHYDRSFFRGTSVQQLESDESLSRP